MSTAVSICIQENNRYGGFSATHHHLCAFECGEPAVQHVRIGGWCGNVCNSRPCEHRAAGGTFTPKLLGLRDEDN